MSSYFKPFVIFIAFLLVGIITFLPAELRNEVNALMAGTIYTFITGLSFGDPSSKNGIAQAAANTELLNNIGHFLAFAVIGTMLNWLSPRYSAYALCGGILIVAGVSELSQNFVVGRDPGWGDFFINAAGGLIGFMTIAWYSRARVHRSKA